MILSHHYAFKLYKSYKSFIVNGNTCNAAEKFIFLDFAKPKPQGLAHYTLYNTIHAP
jgi:hypothetical protein